MRLSLLFISILIVQLAKAGLYVNETVQKEDIFILKPRKKLLKNPRKADPFGLNIHMIGPAGIVSFSADEFITPKIAVETGAGWHSLKYPENTGDLSYFLGGRYHFLGKTPLRLTPYLGMYTVFHHNGKTLRNHSLYIPLGIHKIKRKGLCWSVEAAYQRNIFTNRSFTGAFKIGYRF